MNQKKTDMNKTELYNAIVKKFESNFLKQLPSFGDRMWKLIIEGMFDGRVVVFVPTLKNGWNLSLAEAGDKGYIPLNVQFAGHLQRDYSAISKICDELTEEIFGILPRRAAEIQMQSMGNKNEKA